jgi:hypothetical protein
VVKQQVGIEICGSQHHFRNTLASWSESYTLSRSASDILSVTLNGNRRNTLTRDLVGKPEGRPRRRWEDGVRMDLREIGLGGGVDWIRLAQDRDRWQAVVSAVMNLRVLAPRS